MSSHLPRARAHTHAHARVHARVRALAAVGVLAAVLAGCGNEAAPRATDSSTPSGSPTPTAKPTVGTYPAYTETDYDFTLRVTCFCADANAPVRVEVRDGVAVSATYLKRGPGHRKGDAAPDYRQLTIQEIVDAANDTEAADVQVRWPAGQDYPTSVYVDQNQMTADEEIGYAISDVAPVA